MGRGSKPPGSKKGAGPALPVQEVGGSTAPFEVCGASLNDALGEPSLETGKLGWLPPPPQGGWGPTGLQRRSDCSTQERRRRRRGVHTGAELQLRGVLHHLRLRLRSHHRRSRNGQLSGESLREDTRTLQIIPTACGKVLLRIAGSYVLSCAVGPCLDSQWLGGWARPFDESPTGGVGESPIKYRGYPQKQTPSSTGDSLVIKGRQFSWRVQAALHSRKFWHVVDVPG